MTRKKILLLVVLGAVPSLIIGGAIGLFSGKWEAMLYCYLLFGGATLFMAAFYLFGWFKGLEYKFAFFTYYGACVIWALINNYMQKGLSIALSVILSLLIGNLIYPSYKKFAGK